MKRVIQRAFFIFVLFINAILLFSYQATEKRKTEMGEPVKEYNAACVRQETPTMGVSLSFW